MSKQRALYTENGKVNYANLVTTGRMIISIILLFLPVFSGTVKALYISAGITDMFDGHIARKTGTATRLGARLDTSADLCFTAVCFYKLIPILHISTWLLIWAGVIALLKATAFFTGSVRLKSIYCDHSALNKVTGLLLYLTPVLMIVFTIELIAIMDCTLATAAAIKECYSALKMTDVRKKTVSQS